MRDGLMGQSRVIRAFTDKFIQNKDSFRGVIKEWVEGGDFYDGGAFYPEKDDMSIPEYKNLFRMLMKFLDSIEIDRTLYKINQNSLNNLKSEDVYSGDYLLFFKADNEYENSAFFYSSLSYGSCSVCDSFQEAVAYDKEIEEKVEGLMSLSLHMVQSIRMVHTPFDVEKEEDIEF